MYCDNRKRINHKFKWNRSILNRTHFNSRVSCFPPVIDTDMISMCDELRKNYNYRLTYKIQIESKTIKSLTIQRKAISPRKIIKEFIEKNIGSHNFDMNYKIWINVWILDSCNNKYINIVRYRADQKSINIKMPDHVDDYLCIEI